MLTILNLTNMNTECLVLYLDSKFFQQCLVTLNAWSLRSLITFILKQFVLFDATVKGIHFLFPLWIVLYYCLEILIFTCSFASCNFAEFIRSVFCEFICGICIVDAFYFFSYQIILVGTSSTILNRSGESRIALLQVLCGKLSVFHHWV